MISVQVAGENGLDIASPVKKVQLMAGPRDHRARELASAGSDAELKKAMRKHPNAWLRVAPEEVSV